MRKTIISVDSVSERLTSAREQITVLNKAVSEVQIELREASIENDKFNAERMRASHIDAGLCYAKISETWAREEKFCPNKGKNDGLCGVHNKGWARVARDEYLAALETADKDFLAAQVAAQVAQRAAHTAAYTSYFVTKKLKTKNQHNRN